MMEEEFPAASFVKVKLLKEPIYSTDRELWNELIVQKPEISDFFHQIGQELVVDENEGYAFLRQLDPEGEERVPRLTRRRKLSYMNTLLLVCLREEFLRFDATPDREAALVRTASDLRDMIGNFFPESTDQVRDMSKQDNTIASMVDLGFLRLMKDGAGDRYEVMRIVKARLGPEELERIKEALKEHAEPSNRLPSA